MATQNFMVIFEGFTDRPSIYLYEGAFEGKQQLKGKIFWGNKQQLTRLVAREDFI
jgi:hypothetical protein